jgi:two-component system CheB/CheR fusion protein
MRRILRVLLVDDYSESADSMAALIRRLGHCCLVANDGCRALDDMDVLCPDVVLIELGLKAMSAFEIGRRVRAEHRFDDILLIAVAANGQPLAREATDAAGFDFHMSKPVNSDLLHNILVLWRNRLAALASPR